MAARVKMTDIAEAAGVSAVTVSYALRDHVGGVSAEKRAEIRRIAEEMGYTANPAARILKSKHNPDIGMLVMARDYQLDFLEIMAEVASLCEKSGIRFHIESCDPQNHDHLPPLLYNGMAGGVILVGFPTPRISEYLQQSLLPVVQVFEDGPCSVKFDIAAGVAESVQYLVAQRHTRIGYIDSANRQYHINRDAWRGFSAAVKEFNCDFDESLHYVIDDRKSFRQSVEEAVQKLVLDNPNPPGAILSPWDNFTRAFITCLFANNISVPQDISICGRFLTSRCADMSYPPISTLECNHMIMAQRVFATLRNLMQGQSVSAAPTLLRPTLVIRETIGRSSK